VNDRPPALSSLPLGLIVAGATTGALIAIGHRLGSTGLAFSAIAAALLRRHATTSTPSLVVVGVGLHVVLTLCWTALFVSLVQLRRLKPITAALLVAVLANALSWLIARTTGGGLASVLPLGDRIVFAVVFAASLAIGIRFAFSTSRGPATLL
jgi:hypothetical protein